MGIENFGIGISWCRIVIYVVSSYIELDFAFSFKMELRK